MSDAAEDNILSEILPCDEETFKTIFKNGSIKIERIVSNGQSSPENFWYDQDEYEFVMLVEGDAVLKFTDRDIELSRGDYLIIKPHEKHRVVSTSKSAVWLCAFFR